MWKSERGPRISAHALPLDGEIRFLFYLMEIWFFWKKKNLELPLILILFLNGKQNKKENPKCDSLFGKGGLQKTESGSRVRLLIEKVR